MEDRKSRRRKIIFVLEFSLKMSQRFEERKTTLKEREKQFAGEHRRMP